MENKNLFNNQLLIQFKPVTLYLKRSFNTAHSQSTTRTNFVFKTQINKNYNHSQSSYQSNQKLVGFGQCGLPPKKLYCYISDINDCLSFGQILNNHFNQFIQKLNQSEFKQDFLIQSLKNSFKYIFAGIIELGSEKSVYFDFLRQKVYNLLNQKINMQALIFYSQIFQLLKIGKELSNQHKIHLAPRNALQFALLDLIGNFQNKSVSQIIAGQQKSTELLSNYSFYTLSHQQDLQSMVKNGKQSLIFTPFIKIKFNNNIPKLIDLLILLDKNQVGSKWIIDANACWQPQNYYLFQKLFQQAVKNNPKIKQKVMYIQQPFPIFQTLKDKSSQDIKNMIQQWKKIKENTQFIIIADESFTSFQSFQKVKDISHGINIKMEKCGGPIQATKIINYVKNNKLEHFMFGSMVSTNLGCTQTFQFYRCATYFDIDGGLLVKQPNINGGFQWNGEQGIVKILGTGLALNINDLQKMFVK